MKLFLSISFGLLLSIGSIWANAPLVAGDAVAIDSKLSTSRWKPVWKDLDPWVQRVKRPGWQLQDKASAEGYHFAVFADQSKAIALVVHRWREKEAEETAQQAIAGKGLKIDWSQARDLMRVYALNSNGATDGGAGFSTVRNEAQYEEKEGTWIPIPDGYQGPVQVIYQVTRQGRARTAFRTVFSWPPVKT